MASREAEPKTRKGKEEEILLSRISRAESLCVTLQEELRQCEDAKARILDLEAVVKAGVSRLSDLEARVKYAVDTLPRAPDYKKRAPPAPARGANSSSSSAASSEGDYELSSSSSSEDEGPKVRGKNRKWTDEERDAIMIGAAKHALSDTKWKDVLSDNVELFKGRTAVNLKDTYRTIKRQMKKKLKGV